MGNLIRLEKPLRDYLIIDMLCATGIRVNELVALNCNDLLNRGLLQVGDRVVPYRSNVTWRMPRIGPIFRNKDKNTRLTTRSVRRIVTGYGYKLCLNVSPSILRHSFAMSYLNSGGTFENLAKQLGSTIAATRANYKEFV